MALGFRLTVIGRGLVGRLAHFRRPLFATTVRFFILGTFLRSRLWPLLIPRALTAAAGVFLVVVAAGIGLRFEAPPKLPPTELVTAQPLHDPVAHRPAERRDPNGKSLAISARKAPLREVPAEKAIAGAALIGPPDHFHIDDLPIPPEENLAAVQPNLALPELPPPAVDGARHGGADATPPALRPEGPRTGRPQWLANAVEPNLSGRGPIIAVVIDDVGIDQPNTARAVQLPPPLTLAFIPYGFNLEQHTKRARQRGHELLVHMPMEPSSSVVDPGPNALLTSLPADEIMRRFRWGLSRFDGYVGVSNHMGSRFMARGDLVKPLLEEAERRGLLFLDSWTRADTAGTELARSMELPNARRDVFLDNEQTEDEVTKRLAQLEKIARSRGYAVGLGHPHQVTLQVLERWIPEARARGITLVPISTIVRLEYGEGLERMLAAATGGREANGLLGGAE